MYDWTNYRFLSIDSGLKFSRREDDCYFLKAAANSVAKSANLTLPIAIG
jgi:hypothetical protein